MEQKEIKITVNGQEQRCSPGLTLLDYLKKRDLSPSQAVAELNGEIIKAADLGLRELQEGDKVEFVRFVGGG